MNIMKNNNVKAVDIVLYLIVFVLLQVIFLNGADLMGKHYGIDSAITMAAGTALSGLITIVIFLWRRWSPYSREYIATRPWTALVWVVLLSLGTIIPSQWMIEVLDVDMPKETLELMTKLLGTPWGYLAVGVLAPVAEEMVFRGVILNALKKRWNVKVAVIVPSMLFGIVHVLGQDFSIGSCLLVIIAGTMVGVMFSMIAIESGSVWNSGIVHAIWNIVIIGGGLAIGEKMDKYSVMTYVLNSKSFAITGGEFGIESSVISLIGYIVVIGIAFIMIKSSKKN